MLKTRATGYSLWLMPSGEVYNRLSNIIIQLSREYSTPEFEPHITLIGELIGIKEDVVYKTSQLVKFIKPYTIKLTEVNFLNEYFRCLFIRVKQTDAVIDANLQARKIFNRTNDPKYIPHLSLMYGNFPAQIKEKIISKIGQKINLDFEVESLHLFATDTEPQSWYRVKEFPLK